MRTSIHIMRRTALAAAAVALVAACNNSSEPEPEPEVATMRLTIGAQTVDVSDLGVVTGGPIVIAANTAISAAWLRADGTADPLVTAADFQLTVVPANTGVVTFTRSSAFAGTLNRVAAGATTIEFSLFHVIEGHEDFGPFDVPITVN
jgi:hypothetical protein